MQLKLQTPKNTCCQPRILANQDSWDRGDDKKNRTKRFQITIGGKSFLQRSLARFLHQAMFGVEISASIPQEYGPTRKLLTHHALAS